MMQAECQRIVWIWPLAGWADGNGEVPLYEAANQRYLALPALVLTLVEELLDVVQRVGVHVV